MKSFKLLLFTLLVAIGVSKSFAQDLRNTSQNSLYTYLYKLTPNEAEKLYEKKTWSVNLSFFHTLVDSFPTYESYAKSLPAGHYLQTRTIKDKAELNLVSVPNIDCFVFNNNTDLCLRITDFEGRNVSNATVKVGSKRVRYNKETNCYIDRKSNQKGIIKIKHNDITNYIHLNRKKKNSAFRRTMNYTLFRSPLKYIVQPVNYVVHLPIDGVRSIVKGWCSGTIFYTKQFFIRNGRVVLSWFDDYYKNDKKWENKHGNQLGYLVLDKPKYRLGDTLRIKGYFLTRNAKPIEGDLHLIMYSQNKSIDLGALESYRKGAYYKEMVLHDSLALTIDKRILLHINDKNNNTIQYTSFYLEEYELGKNRMELELQNSKQYKNKPNSITIKGFDDNDLPLVDAKVHLIATAKKTHQSFDSIIFIPDTLFTISKDISPNGKVEIDLPATEFPNANFSYKLSIRLTTSDNEVLSKSRTIDYYTEQNSIDYKQVPGGLQFDIKHNDEIVHKTIDVFGHDAQGKQTPIQPLADSIFPILNHFTKYTVNSSLVSRSIALSNLACDVDIKGQRIKDSLIITCNNPKQLPIQYVLYKKNKEVVNTAISDNNWTFACKAKEANYYLTVNYVWGGKVQNATYVFAPNKNDVTVQVEAPNRISPGETVPVTVTVKDHMGNPVPNVDVTAYGLTSKFKANAPTLKSLSKTGKEKRYYNTFQTNVYKRGAQTNLINYNEWTQRAQIDTMLYYQFRFPGNQLFKSFFKTGDGSTQCAPFVMCKGKQEPVHVVYIDKRPVYFSWTKPVMNYSFLVDGGLHDIELRTRNHSIYIENMRFDNGFKTITSLDVDKQTKGVRIEERKNELSKEEQQRIYPYIALVHPTKCKYAYLKFNNNYQWLKTPGKSQSKLSFTRPLVGEFTVSLPNKETLHLTTERNLSYEFAPQLVKMRSVNTEKEYPKYLAPYVVKQSNLSDLVLTKTKIDKQIEAYEELTFVKSLHNYSRTFTKSNRGQLDLILSYKVKAAVLYYALEEVSLEKDAYLLSNRQSSFRNLKPTEYHLHVFTKDRWYYTQKIQIKSGGKTYVSIPELDRFEQEEKKQLKNRLKNQYIYQRNSNENDQSFFSEYKSVSYVPYTGVGRTISGRIVEVETGEGIPGVTVASKNATYGTISDLNGYYSFKIPSHVDMVSYQFIGFITEQRNIDTDNYSYIELAPDPCRLDELVMVGYGIQKKRAVTGSVAKVLAGQLAGIQIRGASSLSSTSPIYVVDGKVFTSNPNLPASEITSITVLKDKTQCAIYGSSAKNGVILISTIHSSTNEDQNALLTPAFNKGNSLRTNFNDAALWQPELTTNSKGQCTFETTFPDDITKWDLFFLAMDDKRHSGQTQTSIQAFRPLVAQLSVPRFLLESDSCDVLTKVINYTSDTLKLEKNLKQDNKVLWTKTIQCEKANVEKCRLSANADSTSIQLSIETTSGYKDGEKRTIPVLPVGMKKAEGEFYLLEKDTSIVFLPISKNKEIIVQAEASQFDVLQNEIDWLIEYPYSCNEQLASRLIGHLLNKQGLETMGKPWHDKKKVKRLIQKLRNNQNSNGLWGWWGNSTYCTWVSTHVINALAFAKQNGFEPTINEEKLAIGATLLFDKYHFDMQIVPLLTALKQYNVPIAYDHYLTQIERIEEEKRTIQSEVDCLILQQKLGYKIDLSVLKPYKQETMRKGVYYKTEEQKQVFYRNDFAFTAKVYQLLKQDTLGNHETELKQIRNYFIEKQMGGIFRNTYLTATVAQIVFPDLLEERGENLPAEIEFPDGKKITEFPYKQSFEAQTDLQIKKTGDAPIYLSVYQEFWDQNPDNYSEYYTITSSITNKSILKAGEECTLNVTVDVKKLSEYVLVTIPIPAACSYASKPQYFGNEVHREYFKDRVSIFCQELQPGKHTFNVKLLPRYTGKYTVNPAKVELMYHPEKYGNNKIKKIVIE